MPGTRQLETIARGSFTIIDYNDAASITTGITSNKPLTILTDGDGNHRSSLWTTEGTGNTPNVINPVILMSSKNNPIDLTDLSNGYGTITSMQWMYKTNKTNDWVRLELQRDQLGELTQDGENGVCSDVRFKIAQAATTIGSIDVKRFGLIVDCDGPNKVAAGGPLLGTSGSKAETIDFRYDAIFTSEDGIVTSLSAVISYNLHIRGSEVTSVLIYTPNGNVFTRQDNSDLTAIMEFWRGAVVDFSDVNFRWYLKKNTVFNPVKLTATITNGYYRAQISRKDPNIMVGSVFRFTEETNLNEADLIAGTVVEGAGGYSLGSKRYIVTSVDFTGINGSIEFHELLSDGTISESGLDTTKNTGTCLISEYWDYKQGGGWAHITATTAQEGADSGLGNSVAGPWVDPNLNTSSQTDGSSPTGIVGGNVLVVPKEAVTGMQVYKGVAYDLDPSTTDNTAKVQTVTFLDYADPYQITLYSDQGDKIKNKSGWILVKSEVRRGGDLCTAEELSELTFCWTLHDKNGDIRTSENGGDFLVNDGNTDGGQNGIMGKGGESYVVGLDSGNNPIPTSAIATADHTMACSYQRVYILPNDINNKGTVSLELKA